MGRIPRRACVVRTSRFAIAAETRLVHVHEKLGRITLLVGLSQSRQTPPSASAPVAAAFSASDARPPRTMIRLVLRQHVRSAPPHATRALLVRGKPGRGGQRLEGANLTRMRSRSDVLHPYTTGAENQSRIGNPTVAAAIPLGATSRSRPPPERLLRLDLITTTRAFGPAFISLSRSGSQLSEACPAGRYCSGSRHRRWLARASSYPPAWAIIARFSASASAAASRTQPLFAGRGML